MSPRGGRRMAGLIRRVDPDDDEVHLTRRRWFPYPISRKAERIPQTCDPTARSGPFLSVSVAYVLPLPGSMSPTDSSTSCPSLGGLNSREEVTRCGTK
jgi:hypothetical protein